MELPKGMAAEEAKRALEKHRENFSRAGGDKALDTCVKERSPKWLACVLDAETLAQARSCEKS